MNVLTALSPATQVGADDAGTGYDTWTQSASQTRQAEPDSKVATPVHAPYPESWKTPEGWAEFYAIVETEAARRGLPPMTDADLRRLVYL